MEPGKSTINALLTERRAQYLVPNWQRPYSWSEREWEQLWLDLTNLIENRAKNEAYEHFFGTMVIKPLLDQFGDLYQRIIVDGQQRMATVLILFAALRDIAKQQGNTDTADDASMFLFTKSGESKVIRRMVLQKTDQLEFSNILSEELDNKQGAGAICRCYGFFYDKLKVNPNHLQEYLTMADKFRIFTIGLSAQDDANRIFETINYRGRRLRASDLIRNFLMMSIRDLAKQEYAYEEIWLPMQTSLGKNTEDQQWNLERFFKHFLEMKSEADVSDGDVFEKLKGLITDSATDEEVISLLRNIREYAGYYSLILGFKPAENPELSSRIKYLNDLGFTTHYPFLLKAIHATIGSHEISEQQLINILKLIESYYVRRILTRHGTKAVNKVFPYLCKLENENLDEKLRSDLITRKGSEIWPDLFEVMRDLKETPIFKNRNRCFMILNSVERSLNPEPPESAGLSIEHIMVQTLDDKWRAYIGTNVDSLHRKYCDTLPNLTLINGPINSSLSQELYEVKRERWYRESSVKLTREVANKWDKWGEDQLIARSYFLLFQIADIWPHPGDETQEKQLIEALRKGKSND